MERGREGGAGNGYLQPEKAGQPLQRKLTSTLSMEEVTFSGSCSHSCISNPSNVSFLDSSLITCMIVLSLHAWSRVPSTPSSPLCAMHNSVQSSQPREGEVAMAWQHLMAYIVALEKEVQHYKQLLEGASHQLEVASSTPNPPEDGSPTTAMMGHKQTAVEEVTTSSREQQATTWPQDMEHWDALFEGQCTPYLSQTCSTHLRYESTKGCVERIKAVCDLVMQSSSTGS